MMPVLDFTKAFTRLSGLKVTEEITKEGLMEMAITFASLLPPKFLILAAKKNLTVLEFLDWWKKYTFKMMRKHKAEGNMRLLKLDQQSLKLIKMIYAILGSLRLAAQSVAAHKVREWLTPENLNKKLDEVIERAKGRDPDGYITLLTLKKVIEKRPEWWAKQIAEFRLFFGGE